MGRAGAGVVVGRGQALLAKTLRASSLSAVFERVVNRGAGAVVGLVMVFFVSPSSMGLYAAAFLTYTFAQAIGDSAIRQSAALLWYSQRGAELMRRACFIAGAMTAGAVCVFALAAGLSGAVDTSQALMVSSLALAGIFSAAGLPRVTFQEARGEWRFLARRQVIASAASVVVGVALVPVIGIGGGFAQTIACEAAYFLLLPVPSPGLIAKTSNVSRGWRNIAHVSWNNVLGWVQGQAERLVIGIFGGPVLLGYYAVAFQLARSLSDPAAVGLVSWLRNSLSRPGVDRSVVFDSSIQRAAALGSAMQFGIVMLLILPLSQVMPDRWTTSLHMAIVMSISLPIILVHWSMSALLITELRTKEMLPWQAIGVILTVGCGLLLAWQLWVGVAALVGRDLFMMTSRAWLVRRDLTRRAIVAISCAGAGSAIVALAGWGLAAALT